MKVVAASGDDWDEHIDAVLFGYRVNAQASTKFTPFELMYGVKPRLPIDLADAGDCDTADLDAEARTEFSSLKVCSHSGRPRRRTSQRHRESKRSGTI